MHADSPRSPACRPSGYGCSVPLGNNAIASAGCGDGLGSTTGKSWCCKMGPGNPPSTSMPNVLVIGDSVSIGYVGGVTKILSASGTAAVQHGPWDVSDGGAGDTAVGITCLDRWLVTQAQLAVKWDLITFNFGLHDMTCGVASLASLFLVLFASVGLVLPLNQLELRTLARFSAGTRPTVKCSTAPSSRTLPHGWSPPAQSSFMSRRLRSCPSACSATTLSSR